MSLASDEFLDALEEHVFDRPGAIDEAWALFYRLPVDSRRSLVRLKW